jgi:hypothetical protein
LGIGCFVAAAADDGQTTIKTAKEADMTNAHSAVVNVRYMIDDVDAAIAFYTKHFGFSGFIWHERGADEEPATAAEA